MRLSKALSVLQIVNAYFMVAIFIISVLFSSEVIHSYRYNYE